MILLSANHIKKVYGEKILFQDLDLTIHASDKIGIIGINGTGKSSLLKILAAKESADDGEIATSKELVIEYLPQNPLFDENATVIEQIFKGNSPMMKVLRDYEITVELLAQHPEREDLQQNMIELSNQMDSLGLWQLESEAKAILMKFGITYFNQKVNQLSGGQRKKIALAGVLIRPCNLLILDEPTNHLDNDTIDYLEEILKNKNSALLMVTHDRYFLDRITNVIIELDQAQLYRYEGNYECFISLKAEREEIQNRMKEKLLSSYKKELEWMKKGVEARRTKQKARQDRFYEMEESLEGNHAKSLEIAFGTSRLGKKIIQLEEVKKSFEQKDIIKDFTYTVLRNDRIGIIGNNGVGKSTLLNLITGKSTCDSGIIEIGDTVRIGYYTQEHQEMDLGTKVIDYIKDKAEYIKLADGSRLSASRMLERFLFPPAMQYTTISKLSGGERRRLYLLGVLMEDINVLLLDEPTNDLDIYTLQVLEEYIDDFNGPVIVVSHDRYFLDRIAEKIFVCEGNGKISSYPGNYSDYYLRKQSENKSSQEINKKVQQTHKDKKVYKQENQQTILKFTYQEKIEYESIDGAIEALENDIQYIDEAMLQNATNFTKLQALTAKKQELEEELVVKMERWEYLNELADKIRKKNF